MRPNNPCQSKELIKVLAPYVVLCSWDKVITTLLPYSMLFLLSVTLKELEGPGDEADHVWRPEFLILLPFFIPSVYLSVPAVQTPEIRADIESKLIRQLSQRPTKIELQQKNIIPREKSVRDQEFEDRKVLLERKLSRRPTVKELREKRILMYVAMVTLLLRTVQGIYSLQHHIVIQSWYVHNKNNNIVTCIVRGSHSDAHYLHLLHTHMCNHTAQQDV